MSSESQPIRDEDTFQNRLQDLQGANPVQKSNKRAKTRCADSIDSLREQLVYLTYFPDRREELSLAVTHISDVMTRLSAAKDNVSGLESPRSREVLDALLSGIASQILSHEDSAELSINFPEAFLSIGQGHVWDSVYQVLAGELEKNKGQKSDDPTMFHNFVEFLLRLSERLKSFPERTTHFLNTLSRGEQVKEMGESLSFLQDFGADPESIAFGPPHGKGERTIPSRWRATQVVFAAIAARETDTTSAEGRHGIQRGHAITRGNSTLLREELEVGDFITDRRSSTQQLLSACTSVERLIYQNRSALDGNVSSDTEGRSLIASQRFVRLVQEDRLEYAEKTLQHIQQFREQVESRCSEDLLQLRDFIEIVLTVKSSHT